MFIIINELETTEPKQQDEIIIHSFPAEYLTYFVDEADSVEMHNE